MTSGKSFLKFHLIYLNLIYLLINLIDGEKNFMKARIYNNYMISNDDNTLFPNQTVYNSNSTQISSNNTNIINDKDNNKKIYNNQQDIMWTISPQIKAYSFVDFEGLVYDLSKLYDGNKDYIINKNNSYYYFNIGSFGVTTCKKDNTFIVYVNEKDLNTSECLLLSGTNKEKPSKWRIRSNFHYDHFFIILFKIFFYQK